MMLFARKDGLLALKQERQLAVEKTGGVILGFGDRNPRDGILLADCRPKGFVGGRTADDPAATAIYGLS